MTKPNIFRWNAEKSAWSGLCPRCGSGSFYRPELENHFNGASLDVLHCFGGHIFAVEYAGSNRDAFEQVFPRVWFGDIPDWLPEIFHDVFRELFFARGQKKFRSVIALSGLLLEAHVNEQLNIESDKKKSLFNRLQFLKEQGKIDADQFSDATITRLTRNDVLHPKDILAEVSEKDADEVMRSVVAYLERAYKFRSSRALPPGTEDSTSGTKISQPTS